MSTVWGMILQRGSTIKVSNELPVATRHHLDMTKNAESDAKPEQTTTTKEVFSFKNKINTGKTCL